MRIATWNIYWLGDRTGEHITRTSADEALIADVIRKVAPDVLALQEIVDPLVMERILERASGDGREYVIRSDEGRLLTAPANLSDSAVNLQKLFLCINKATIEILRMSALGGGPGRQPFAALIRDRTSQGQCVVVAVHLRSGFPSFLDATDAAVRRQETMGLAQWLRGESAEASPEFPTPGIDDVVVLGDFNAELEDPNHSLDPLNKHAPPGWLWKNPDPDGERRETALYASDRYIIDFILLSPSLKGRLALAPRVYAWDCDSAHGGPAKFHHGANPSADLLGYGVSDHRPVYCLVN